MDITSYIRKYKVNFCLTLRDCLEKYSKDENAFALIDSNVYRLYKEEIVNSFHLNNIIIIDALETNKSFERIGEYIVKLLEINFRKNSQLIVVGGGVLQDIGGFISSILYRGVTWSLIPTTLLAQCDSCIGSKTSLNILNFKNQLGTFYPPTEINICTEVIQTLTKEDISSGVCEALKLAMIESEIQVDEMSKSLSIKDKLSYLNIVKQCLTIKKKYIEEDEMDKGIRNLLNYGHTFGHAFESTSAYIIPHGIAVGIGIIAANYFSYRMNLQLEEDYRRSFNLIIPWVRSHISIVKTLNIDSLLNIMKSDKKNTSNQIGFVLTRGYGKMERIYLNYDSAKELLKEFIFEIEKLKQIN
jgi:3-dehydroquinate synthase